MLSLNEMVRQMSDHDRRAKWTDISFSSSLERFAILAISSSTPSDSDGCADARFTAISFISKYLRGGCLLELTRCNLFTRHVPISGEGFRMRIGDHVSIQTPTSPRPQGEIFHYCMFNFQRLAVQLIQYIISSLAERSKLRGIHAFHFAVRLDIVLTSFLIFGNLGTELVR